MDRPRMESQIFEDLVKLTTSPGYVHAIASICLRDNFFSIEGSLQASDMDRLFDSKRLIRTEITTLIGLMAKKPLDLSLPSAEIIDAYIKRTDALMNELHRAMSSPTFTELFEQMKSGQDAFMWTGQHLREPIFYGSESAYAFQYRDFVPEKYRADDDWLLENKGFTSNQARSIAKALCELMGKKVTRLFQGGQKSQNQPDAMLSAFEFSIDEVVSRSGVEIDVTKAFFNAFLYTGNNEAFKELGDFNEVAAWPLIPTGRGTVLLFSNYSIYEAMYESPFFWMWADKSYRSIANKHRGNFTEQFAARRLASVFGPEHVLANVNLYRGKERVGETDVLVVYGDRLIIVQAKAKKLTLEARKGNDNKLKADFAAAIQDSYNQGLSCANEVLAGGCRLVDDSGKVICLPENIKEIFLFSLVSEHYPALAFQVSQSLQFQATDIIQAPFVMDVFLLDTLTEMLASPLRFLSYIRLRVGAIDKIMYGHELTVLGYHLKQNLWLNDEFGMYILEDSVARDLDAAMSVRRENIPGSRTPPGILTKMRGTRYEQLINEIESNANPAVLELGFFLLSLEEDSCRNVHKALEQIIQKTKFDGKRHDVTLEVGSMPCGVCFHCNPTITSESVAVLEHICEKRKYRQKAPKWFGISIHPNGQVQFGITLDFPWKKSDEMDRLTKGMATSMPVHKALTQSAKSENGKKLRRNDLCHCGSGRKYKKCCLH